MKIPRACGTEIQTDINYNNNAAAKRHSRQAPLSRAHCLSSKLQRPSDADAPSALLRPAKSAAICSRNALQRNDHVLEDVLLNCLLTTADQALERMQDDINPGVLPFLAFLAFARLPVLLSKKKLRSSVVRSRSSSMSGAVSFSSSGE